MLDALLAHLTALQPDLARGWFGRLRADSVEGGVLRVETENAAQASYLERRCLDALNRAAQAVTERLVTVAIVTHPPHERAEAIEPNASLGDPTMTFEGLVVGPCNELAAAAAMAVADAPGEAYNPLFLHGPLGSGKTHLACAIAERVRVKLGTELYSQAATQWTARLVSALESGGVDDLRLDARAAAGFVIDDVQDLAGCEQSQEELFHTINALLGARRPLVFTADRPPSELGGFEPRLLSRFAGGLVAALDPPDLETRVGILTLKARQHSIEAPADVLRLVASRVPRGGRELVDSIILLDSAARMKSVPIHLDLAEELFASGPATQQAAVESLLVSPVNRHRRDPRGGGFV